MGIGAILGGGAALLGVLNSNDGGGASASQERAIAQQAQIAMEQWNRFKEVYAPLEDVMVSEAMQAPDYDTAVGKAVADVGAAYGKAEGARRREIGRYGLDPSMRRGEAVIRQENIDKAKTEVQARNVARQQEEDKAWAKKIAAVSLGKGLPATAGTMLSSAATGYGNIAGRQQENARAGYSAAGYWLQRGLSDVDFGGGGDDNFSGVSGVNEGSQQDFMLAEQNYGL